MTAIPTVMRCPDCGGHGLVPSPYSGEPTECRACRGSGCVRARDEKGRFIPMWPTKGEDQ